jgi:hypothetical protein
MLRAIFSSILSALRGLAGFIFSFGIAPLRLFDRLLGGDGGGAAQEIPVVRPYDAATPHDGADTQALHLEIANKVMAWAADSIVADRPVALPAGMPVPLKQWLPGLTRQECEVLINASEKAVSAHLQKLFALPEVRNVRRLDPIAEWAAEPKPDLDQGSPSFAAFTDVGWPARSKLRARAWRS